MKSEAEVWTAVKHDDKKALKQGVLVGVKRISNGWKERYSMASGSRL
jgi:hypothetical protein